MKLSIITVNLNNCEGLRRTIDSVISQTFVDYEWIIIDGGSSDGSKTLIEQYVDRFSYWRCEQDNGVYAAMNKGIAHASGEYLQFLNSGDWLYDANTLEHVFHQVDGKSDIYYGNMVQVNDNDRLNPISYPDELGFFYFPYGNICHQATFYRRTLFDGNPYDESFSIVSDWAMNMKLLFIGVTFKHLNQTIVYYDNTGRSSEANEKHHIERTAAFDKYVPQQIKNDLKHYEQIYHFSRHRKSTRWIMDHAIRFCQWLDRMLQKKERRKK